MTTTPDQLAAFIRYNLDQLSAQNKHHEFEHLCRHFARARICSNILPATGPVSAGGDQGRDFETFRTYLQRSTISDSTFIGLSSDRPIAFACTLTAKSDLRAKIRSDIETITGSGSTVSDIHYFCSSDLAVGSRHQLQHWAEENFHVRLEIHDGQSISEQLTASDIFWIACRYLSIPAEMYPEPVAINDWYRNLVNTWRTANHPPLNYADFMEIKAGVRHSSSVEGARPDLLFWLDRLEQLVSSSPIQSLRRKSLYEIAVASLKGLGSLLGVEDKIREYFVDFSTELEPSEYEDAGALLSYCIGAHFQNLVNISQEELSSWRDLIFEILDAKIARTDLPGQRADTLAVLAYMHLSPSPNRTILLNIEGAMKCWLEIAAIVEYAPLFPLEQFADRLVKYMGLTENFGELALSDHPDFSTLTQRIDTLLAKRHGGFVAAQKCRDRAFVLYKSGKLTKAIKEFHRGKVDWYAQETLKGLLLTGRSISRLYHDLGLLFAAKYYALATAYIASHSSDSSLKRFIPSCLIDAAFFDYSQGAWLSYLELIETGLLAFRIFAREVDPTSMDSQINQSLYHALVIYDVARRYDPALAEFVQVRVTAWELSDDFAEILSATSKIRNDRDLDELWQLLQTDIMGRPFSDTGEIREVEFKALGVTWGFRFDNTYDVAIVAEYFLASLQILLADLDGIDLCLLETTVTVQIMFGESSVAQVEPKVSNDSVEWKLTLPSNFSRNTAELQIDEVITGIVIGLLEYISLLPLAAFHDVITNAFQNGLAGKLFFAQQYDLLYRDFVTEQTFENSQRWNRQTPEPNREFRPVQNHQLDWIGVPGPGYSTEKSLEFISNRYRAAREITKYTLVRLSEDASFQVTIQNLRKEGWLDWHILLAIMNAAINYRIAQEIPNSLYAYEADRRAEEIAHRSEMANDPQIPLRVFTELELRHHLQGAMLAILATWGLEIHQQTPNFDAILDFLVKRYNFLIDDIAHDRLF